MAEFQGEPFPKPKTSDHAASDGGFMGEVKNHKIEVIIGGATLLVTFWFLSRGKSGATNAGTGSGTTGNLSTSGSTSVSTNMLASAMQQLSAQEQKDMQSLQQQMAAYGQTVASVGSGSTASSGAPGVSGFPGGSNVPGGQGYPGSSPVQSNGNAITNALQARNKLGDTTIISFFSNLSLPSWIGLQYVAENLALPWQPGTTPTSAQLSNFNNWLDEHGYRSASTNSFTPVVSSGTVPANVQAEINAAYGG